MRSKAILLRVTWMDTFTLYAPTERGSYLMTILRTPFVGIPTKKSYLDKIREKTHEAYNRLAEKILAHDRRYYLDAQPILSDYAYDQLVKHIENIENKHPDWVTPASPTQKIGGGACRTSMSVPHQVPMLSLSNTYSQQGIEEFIERMSKRLAQKQVDVCCELKVDGVAVTVRYKKGRLFQALTRGNGRQGEDITSSIKMIKEIPLQLKSTQIPEDLEVRGEIFITHAVFKGLNQERLHQGKPTFKNRRDATAGSLNLTDVSERARRKLRVLFYDIAAHEHIEITTQFDCHHYLGLLGLPRLNPACTKICRTSDEIGAFVHAVAQQRHRIPFDIDGVVIKVNQLKAQRQLGSTHKTPRFAIAYKFKSKLTLTRVRSIIIQVGRLGTITPVALIDPIWISGSTLSKVKLHYKKDIRVGDYVWIEKKGGVIAQIVSVALKRRPASALPWQMPLHCPHCHHPITNHQAQARCSYLDCPERRMRRLIHFSSRNAMHIRLLGPKIAQTLFEKKVIQKNADIYTLQAQQLHSLGKFNDNTVSDLLKEIEKSKKVSLSHFIFALGIEKVGTAVARSLALHTGSLHDLAHMCPNQLRNIRGISTKTALSISAYFKQQENRQDINTMLLSGIEIDSNN